MPSFDEHCNISKKRTGYAFTQLHKWMDEPQKELKQNHRRERHTLDDTYLNFVKSKWGELGVLEFIHHIVEDYQETENKYMQKLLINSKTNYIKKQ